MKRRLALHCFCLWATALMATLVASCSGADTSATKTTEGTPLTKHARYLTMKLRADSTLLVELANPWNADRPFGRFVLVDSAKAGDPTVVPDGYRIVRVPVASALVYSSVHTTPLEEIGGADMVTGVADSRYFTSPYIAARLAKGTIADVGNAMAPSLEKIVDLSPQIALISPYENSGHGVLDNTGAIVFDMADYMEPAPLGRAEWLLLLGALSGRLDEATAVYTEICRNYEAIRAAADTVARRPRVLMETPYSGVWYQPGNQSYMARLIHDAGGDVLFDSGNEKGSLQLDIATVFDKGADADVWLIKTDRELTADDLTDITPLAPRIKAFRTDNVWYANTSRTDLYDDLAFHPERVLADYIAIFHGDNTGGRPQTKHFKKITRSRKTAP